MNDENNETQTALMPTRKCDTLDIRPGEAMMTIRVACTVTGEGVQFNLDVHTMKPKFKTKVHGFGGTYATLLASIAIDTLNAKIKPMLNEETFDGVQRQADADFLEAMNEIHAKRAARKDGGEDDE